MPIAHAIVNVPVMAVILSRYQVSVMDPATRVPHLPPAVVYGPNVIRVVADGKLEASSDSTTPVMVVPGVPKTWKVAYRNWLADTAPMLRAVPVAPPFVLSL